MRSDRIRPRGIDISHHQGQPNYETVRAQGFDFVIHKATEGATWFDPMYTKNRAAIPETLWGAYHVLRLDSPSDTMAEVDNFLRHAIVRPGDLPPTIDVETKYIKADPSPEVDVLNIKSFASEIRYSLGVEPLLYVSPRGLKKLGEVAGYLQGMQLWVADYDQDPTDELPDGFHDWLFWQYTSDGPGQKCGFESRGLDLNHFNGSMSSLNRLRIL